MNSHKKSAKELLKNKTALARIRNERKFKEVVTRRTNMTKAGNLPKKPAMMTFAKKTAVKNNKPVIVKTNTKTNTKTNGDDKMAKSMRVYKNELAIPFAKIGLHDPKSPNYHTELVQNMKNLANRRSNILPMHNKQWFVDQLKRNVWALRNNQPVTMARCPGVTTAAAPAPMPATKTKKLLMNRKGQKTAKPKAMSSKKLLNQLKSIKPVK
jgi:hypothetical protein